MAESVDALVSNTCGRKAVPVRPRLWVHTMYVKSCKSMTCSFFIFIHTVLCIFRRLYKAVVFSENLVGE